MSRNGSGVYSLPAGNPVVTGTTISSTWANNTLTDIANALTQSIASNGVTVPSANLPMSGFRHTNVGNGSARNDYAAVGQVQDSSFLWGGTAGGTADARTITLTPAITAYASGQRFVFVNGAADNATTTPTLNINGVGAKTIVKRDGTALTVGDMPANAVIDLIYDGTNFRLITITSTSGLTLLSSFTVSVAVANIDFLSTFNTTYDDYLIIGEGISSSAADGLRLRLATGGAADAGATNYLYILQETKIGGTTWAPSSSAGGGGATIVMNSTTSDAATHGSFIIKVTNANATTRKHIFYELITKEDAVNGILATHGFAAYTPVNTASGFRLYWGAGNNFDAGTVKVYGIRKS